MYDRGKERKKAIMTGVIITPVIPLFAPVFDFPVYIKSF